MDDDGGMEPGEQPITARCTADPTHRDLEWSLVKGVLTTVRPVPCTGRRGRALVNADVPTIQWGSAQA